jgi:ABC-type Zn2+ transport system substrate-binding protein/surface adhesin
MSVGVSAGVSVTPDDGERQREEDQDYHGHHQQADQDHHDQVDQADDHQHGPETVVALGVWFDRRFVLHGRWLRPSLTRAYDVRDIRTS